jgi:hypothetical protein
MLSQKINNYHTPLIKGNGSKELYVLMEMLVEFKVIKSRYMPIYASRLRNLHYDLKQIEINNNENCSTSTEGSK